jgi:hypothetical protein
MYNIILKETFGEKFVDTIAQFLPTLGLGAPALREHMHLG